MLPKNRQMLAFIYILKAWICIYFSPEYESWSRRRTHQKMIKSSWWRKLRKSDKRKCLGGSHLKAVLWDLLSAIPVSNLMFLGQLTWLWKRKFRKLSKGTCIGSSQFRNVLLHLSATPVPYFFSCLFNSAFIRAFSRAVHPKYPR